MPDDRFTLRVHFTPEDLARTRVGRVNPMAETVGGLLALRHRRDDPFDWWRRRAHERLTPRVRSLGPIFPTAGLYVDLLSGLGEPTGFEQALDGIRRINPRTINAEVRWVMDRPRSVWVRDLAEAEPVALEHLADALAEFHHLTVAPYWGRMRAALEADRAQRASHFLDGGVEHMLANLGPFARWRPPVLEVASPRDTDVHLWGHGLTLVPTVLYPFPEVMAPADLPYQEDPRYLLVYPAVRDVPAALRLWSPPAGTGNPLVPMLGRVRAAVLETIGDCPEITSTELARRLDISAASVSEHTTVLRNGGLVTSTRHRNTVRHRTTPVGHALLDGVDRPGVPVG